MYGSRWIYSAGFNVAAGARQREPQSDDGTWRRVDTELPDLVRLVEAGARVAVLSHQGTAPASADHLDHVARHLARRMGRPVGYVPTAVGPTAVAAAQALRPGEISLFGNTRFYPGEQRNDPALAIEFAKLGDLAAIGGFAKAHRPHASNVGMLAYRPAFAADSLVREVSSLAPWMHPTTNEGYSVAVLGGVKPEKIEVGLVNLIDRYDLVIVGGVVLNGILAAQGHPVGGSELGGAAATRCVASARAVLSRPHRAKLHIPSIVMVAVRTAQGLRQRRPVAVGTAIRDREAIVDFMLDPWARRQLRLLRTQAAKCLIAGTPALYTQGCRATTDALLEAFAAPGVQTLLLGGDTLAELPWNGAASSGGGSALTLLTTGTCEVFDALRRARRGPLSPYTR